MAHEQVIDATEQVLVAALRMLSAERALDSTDPNADAQHEYASEQLALAARVLTGATNALPPERQPVGWHEPQTASTL